MATVACSLVRWVSDQPQPGLVEAHLTDADGTTRRFIDKVPIFSSAVLTAESAFPRPGVIRCEVVGSDAEAPIVVTISTATDGVESTDGETVFTVPLAVVRQ